MQSPITFKIIKEIEGGAGAAVGRAGILTTPHGDIHTPAFVPVATKASLKGINPEQIVDLGVQVLLANTYHLYLEPGDERVAKAGGLHQFMQWNKPTMTDSGGYQVFSLGVAFGTKIKKIADAQAQEMQLPEKPRERGSKHTHGHFKPAQIDANGVMFRSHLDGSAHYFTPEKSIDIQHNIGADIIFAFDECTAPQESPRYQAEALDRTHRWARQSLAHHHANKEQAEKQALFGIVQGGRVEALRKESAQVIGSMAFDGFGIGGSFEKQDMSQAVMWVNELLPKEKPRHLLGIGEPEDLLMAIERGCDLFDCVLPTRLGRTGTIFTRTGKVNLHNSRYRDDHTPLDPSSTLASSRMYTRAYVAHLLRTDEILGGILTSMHNVHFITTLVAEARQAIIDNRFAEYKHAFLAQYQGI